MTDSAFVPISPNPFIVGNPVRGRAMFFGREAEFELVQKRFGDSPHGGLLVFFTLELFKRRPPSPRARHSATNVGLVVVVALMVLALRNDVVRFLWPT